MSHPQFANLRGDDVLHPKNADRLWKRVAGLGIQRDEDDRSPNSLDSDELLQRRTSIQHTMITDMAAC